VTRTLRTTFCLLAATLVSLVASDGRTQIAGDRTLIGHALQVTIDPGTHELGVVDHLTLPPALSAAPMEFVLNARLRIARATPEVREVPLGDLTRFLGVNGQTPAGVQLKRYRADAPAGVVELEYAGAIDYGLSDQKEEYTRGFRETAGIIGPEGVYLAGSGFWYPQVDTGLVEFSVEVREPSGWHVISQGAGTSRDERGMARWRSEGPMDEIYLVGGPLRVTRDSAGPVETLVYLHEDDPALAGKYLAATAQYLEMYRGLIGPYPYGKFALVENFWETGYGMPSFTLLGPGIIRFPFIITTSYPHEILHNWWGNSVFVDYPSGNWAEGLTAYLADHLMQEQRGGADQYRRSTLQKYRDYVKDGRDFPLTEFRSRESAATEAVGYGKTLMAFHMLRRRMGDDEFRRFLARFYREFKGRRASFADVQRTAEAVTGSSLARFFEDWTTRPGAPALSVTMESVGRPGGNVEGTLHQTQDAPPFALDVPVLLQTPSGDMTREVHFDGTARDATFGFGSVASPLALRVDPYFDVFRKLDPRETPPSIGQIFGESRILAVLPSREGADAVAGYRALVSSWTSPAHAIDVALDSTLGAVPDDRSVWLLGRENSFARKLFERQPGVSIEPGALTLDGQRFAAANHTAVLVTRHPRNVEKAIGWIVADPAAALPGLGRKLPHYGKYSYLGFEGDEPVNVLSGQWQIGDSPLTIDLRPADARTDRLPTVPADPAKALADLPPVFSQKTLAGHVATLADPALEGRGLGSAGLRKAADYVAAQFKKSGLVPGGDDGGYLQKFTVAEGPEGRPVDTWNVIGYVPGTRGDWASQSVVVSAHYDHLGRGWPDVHKGDEGRVHPGADDNASGVAVMLELARVFAAGERPMRNLVFIAFSAEEAGLRGSRYFVEHPSPFPLDGVRGVINLDTVGRLGAEKVSVLGTGTASEWQHIFMGAGFVTGIQGRNVPDSLQSSDQVPFVERGVPAVQIFSGAHADYHRPTDTTDRIDVAGLVRIAAFVREAVAYLAERPEPLTVTIPTAGNTAPAAPAAAPATGRRVSFGTVPDFAFTGPGVRVDGLVSGSPAERAGVRVGDVILEIDGTPVANLQAFSDRLKALSPGQTVTVRLERGSETVTVRVTVEER
jgi:aminopeptidase N